MTTAEDYREVAPGEWCDVIVRVEGTWWPGELLAWHRRDHMWLAEVSYRDADEDQLGAIVQYNHVKAAPHPSGVGDLV